jgi:hypothetical protein
VSIRIPEPGPLGETFFEASTLAIVGALAVKSPGGGCVESVVTFATHREGFLFSAMASSPASETLRAQIRYRQSSEPCTTV